VPVAAPATLVSVTELVGSVIVCAAPTFTVGTVLALVELLTTSVVLPPAAALTVTDTVEEADCPRLFVAVKVKT
jgi:hypothetical protein